MSKGLAAFFAIASIDDTAPFALVQALHVRQLCTSYSAALLSKGMRDSSSSKNGRM